jgi:hypothetical protein
MKDAGAVGAQDLDGFELTAGLHVNVSGNPEALPRSLHRIVSFWNANRRVVIDKFAPLPQREVEYAGPYKHLLAFALEKVARTAAGTIAQRRSAIKDDPDVMNNLEKYQAINLTHMVSGVESGSRDAFEVRIFDAAYAPSDKRPDPCAYVERAVAFSLALVNWAEAPE